MNHFTNDNNPLQEEELLSQLVDAVGHLLNIPYQYTPTLHPINNLPYPVNNLPYYTLPMTITPFRRRNYYPN